MNFKAIAKEKTSKSASPIMEGKVKVSMDDIISTYPNGITLTAFDFINMTDETTGEVSTFPVINFAENPGVFAFGGKVLNEICASWAEMCDGSAALASKSLAEDGGVKLKFYKGKTKKGRTVTMVDVVE